MAKKFPRIPKLSALLDRLLSESEPTQEPPISPNRLPSTETTTETEPPQITDIRKGYILITLFFGSLFAWGLLTPLSSASIAPGEVYIEGHRKQIQHLEGGIVREILVSDGQAVKAGQALVKLEDIQVRSDYETVRSRLLLNMARTARLEAEYRSASNITFPDWLMDQRDLPDVASAMKSQENIFNARQELSAEQRKILELKVSQKEEQLHGDSSRLQGLRSQLRLIRAERKSYQRLVDEQLVTRKELYSLEAEEQGLIADIGEVRSSIAQIGELINQYRVEDSQLSSGTRRTSSEQLDVLKGEMLALQQKLGHTRNRLEQTTIRSPIDGIIVDQKVHTAGGVIMGGQSIAQVVPSDGTLMISAKINPKDRDTVRAGQKAEIRFSAFNQRSSRPIKGRVALISADRLINETDGSPYFQARIEMLEKPEDVIKGGSIYAGMQAEVIIVTGSRTAIAYLIDPLLRSMNRSLKEE